MTINLEVKMSRKAKLQRTTKETKIELELELDGTGRGSISTTVSFLDHLLELMAKQGKVDLTVSAQGDTHVDDHHLVEDVGITLGQGLNSALGDKLGINRYGWSVLPMDEALVEIAVDISNRPYLFCDLGPLQAKVGTFDTELVEEFLKALAHNAGLTLHVSYIRGDNTNNILEAAFKGLGLALRQAVSITREDLPSTKGVL